MATSVIQNITPADIGAISNAGGEIINGSLSFKNTDAAVKYGMIAWPNNDFAITCVGSIYPDGWSQLVHIQSDGRIYLRTPLPVDSGGTGAITPAGACENIGVIPIPQYSGAENPILSFNGQNADDGVQTRKTATVTTSGYYLVQIAGGWTPSVLAVNNVPAISIQAVGASNTNVISSSSVIPIRAGSTLTGYVYYKAASIIVSRIQ